MYIFYLSHFVVQVLFEGVIDVSGENNIYSAFSISGGNQCVRRKPQNFSMLLIYFITQCCIEYTDGKQQLQTSYKRCSVRFYLQLFVGRLMSYLRYMCLLAYGGVQHILCFVFVLFVFVLCTLSCQFLWIVHFL